MAEPGAPSFNANLVANQPNNQGDFSRTHYNSFIPTGGISGGNAVQATAGGVGFSNDGNVDSNEGTGEKGENDEVRDDEFTSDSNGIQKESVMRADVPESPFVKYVQRNLSDGKEQKPQRYHADRSMGRGMNSDQIRNGVWYGESEADIFTWNQSPEDPINRADIEMNEYEKHRDV